MTKLILQLILCACFYPLLSGVVVADTTPSDPQVVLETSLGNIIVEVYQNKAPLSAGDFLAYVDQGLFDNQLRFHRVVRPDNDQGEPVISVIQAGLAKGSSKRPPVAHESTRDTGLRHIDGTLSIARSRPGTGGGSDFFICIGEQSALDFGGKRNPDGQGFAAFGRVIKGMDVVRRINALKGKTTGVDDYVNGQMLAEPIFVEQARRLSNTNTP